MSYCKPLCAGPESETAAVARRLGRLMTALENEVTGHVVEGTILEDIVRLKRSMMTELRARGWRVNFEQERVSVKRPIAFGKTGKAKIAEGL